MKEILIYNEDQLDLLTDLWWNYFKNQKFFVLPKGDYLARLKKEDFVDNFLYELRSTKSSILKNTDQDYIWFGEKTNKLYEKNILSISGQTGLKSFCLGIENNDKLKITVAVGSDDDINELINRYKEEYTTITFHCYKQGLVDKTMKNDFELRSILEFRVGQLNHNYRCPKDVISATGDQEGLFNSYIDRNLPATLGLKVISERERNNGETFAFLEKDKIIGSLGPNYIVKTRSGIYGKIGTFYVQPEYRNKKVGHKLFERTMAYFAENKAQFVPLKVNKNNLPARKIYDYYGFKIVKNLHVLNYSSEKSQRGYCFPSNTMHD